MTDIETDGPVDVTALFGGQSLTGFELDVVDGGFALTELTIVPEPGASVAGLAALAAARQPARRART